LRKKGTFLEYSPLVTDHYHTFMLDLDRMGYSQFTCVSFTLGKALNSCITEDVFLTSLTHVLTTLFRTLGRAVDESWKWRLILYLKLWKF
jgi:hypothetical protein